MKAARTVFVPIVAALILTVIGCDENARLAEMAERHLDRQAEQNRQMAELHRQVADGSRELVAADAKAREELAALQREVQTERAETGRQRDELEKERRSLAAERRQDPIIAAAITSWYRRRRAPHLQRECRPQCRAEVGRAHNSIPLGAGAF